MVTIVNDYYTPSNTYSMYEGMSISDAANYMVLECNNAIHDLEMDILLTEHAYLLENGYEIEYINEEGTLNKIKEKITAVIDKVIKVISELWQKVMDFISEKMTALTTKLFSLAFPKKTYLEYAKSLNLNQLDFGYMKSGGDKIVFVPIKTIKDLYETGLVSSLGSDIPMFKTNEFYKAVFDRQNKVFSKSNLNTGRFNIEGFEKKIIPMSPDFATYVYDYGSVVKDLKTEQAKVISIIKDLKKTVDPITHYVETNELGQVDNTVYEKLNTRDHDNIKELNDRLKSNVNVTRDCIKLITDSAKTSMWVIMEIYYHYRQTNKKKKPATATA